MTVSTPRLGAIPTLNALPLTAGLRHEPEGTVLWGQPSQLAEALHRGEVELALVPQVEVCRDPDARIVDGLGIACRGRVDSILLFGTRSPETARRVAVDSASRSSVELLRVLFHLEGWPIPETVVAPEELGPEDLEGGSLAAGGVDALLRIGDRALAARGSAVPRRDLGEWWHAATGLPFVFALWTGRVGVDRHLVERVRWAADWGRAHRDRIAREFARAHPSVFGPSVLGEEAAIEYVTSRVHHTIGPEEHEALVRFAALRREIGSAVPDGWRPRTFEEGA